MEASMKFYGDLMGCITLSSGTASGTNVSVGVGVADSNLKINFIQPPNTNTALELIQYVSPIGSKLSSYGLNYYSVNHLAFFVDDIHAVYNTLKSNAVTFFSAEPVYFEAKKIWMVIANDPDGNAIQFIQPPPATVAPLLKKNRLRAGTGIASHILKFDHVGITVSDLTATTNLFVNVFGGTAGTPGTASGTNFSLALNIASMNLKNNFVSFPNSDTRFELMEFVNPAGRALPYHAPNAFFMTHVCFQVSDTFMVNSLMEKNGYTFESGPQYVADSKLYFNYMYGPNNIMIEFLEDYTPPQNGNSVLEIVATVALLVLIVVAFIIAKMMIQ
eukprot:TRINITY_DN2401_c0_g1_i1.p1 TRINITY_DN2401_c0_g1~~TRINITY_DN2401_c0_g1_i1.p1  ORF type:complete len:344 (+),score=60.43 TRINITY_DN2401_c0_g1_i1:42-1034(+)